MIKVAFHTPLTLKSYRILIWSCLTILFLSCNEKKKDISQETSYTFHADNDIAMVVGSIIDSMNMGENLDSTQYTFHGILTDGYGSPLYTDFQGNPGQWEVEIVDSHNAVIRNTKTGDLLPEDLKDYISRSSGLEIAFADTLDETEKYIYLFEKGNLRYEIRNTTVPNGLDGVLVSIFISATPYTAL